MRSPLQSVAVLLLGFGALTAASAGPVGPNLVVNGGFESSTTVAASGWTVSGAYATEGFDYFLDTDAADAQSGSHSFAGGAIGSLGFLSQNLATVAGQTYDIHLSLANFSGFSDGTAVQVLWNGQTVYSATDILGSGYREIVIDPVAAGALTTLAIGLQDDEFFLNLDSVSVRAIAVPEPATIALVLGGGALFTVVRRRRRPG